MPAAKKQENETLQKNVRFYHQFMNTPKDAQKPFNNGRFSGTDINPMYRIKVLTEVFGPSGFGWWTQNVKYEFVEADLTRPNKENTVQKETAVFCELELIVKDPETGEISQPIYGVGGNTFIAEGKYGPRSSDEAKKMAYTDALSIACKSLGIGHDIWYSNDRTKYTMQSDTEEPPKKPAGKQNAAPEAKTETKSEAKQEAPQEHTPDTAAVIDEIAKRLAEIGANMQPEEKKQFAIETIKPIIGDMKFRTCTDITKLIALRDKLSA